MLLEGINYDSHFPCTPEGPNYDFYCPIGSIVKVYEVDGIYAMIISDSKIEQEKPFDLLNGRDVLRF